MESARGQLAKLIHAAPKEIIFTSGATESNNLAIKGVAEMYREKGNHIITQVTEHKAVLDTCKRLGKYGYQVTYWPVAKDGRVDPDDLRRAITPKTILIAVMYANNEIGVIQPIAEIGKIAKEKGILFLTDAVQAVGKVLIDVNKENVDLLAMTGHKIYGPKGCGALYVRRRNPRVQLTSIIDGGGHERGMRSGTLNVPGIVGFGRAAELCQKEMAQESERLRGLRDRLHDLPGAEQLKRKLRFCGGRVTSDGHQRRGCVDRFGLYLGQDGAELRSEGAGCGRGTGPEFDSVWTWPIQHARGSGLRDSARRGGGQPLA